MAYRSARADYIYTTRQVTLKLFVYHSFECDSQVYDLANISSIGAPCLVTYSRDVGLNRPAILVAAIITPSVVHWCPMMLPVYKSLPSSGSALVTEKHAIPARSTNPISLWLIHTRLEYHGLCLLRRSFLELEIEACRTRSVAFPLWRSLVTRAKMETSVTSTRPAEQQAGNDTIRKCLAM
jgi:hypothetical protein